jgi:hypothetical protein
MIRNHQTQIFSSFECTIVKLLLIDFWARQSTIKKIVKNRHINVYSNYALTGQWIFSTNIPKDRAWIAEKNELFDMLYAIYLLRSCSPAWVQTVTIYESMILDNWQYIWCHFLITHGTTLDFWYIMQLLILYKMVKNIQKKGTFETIWDLYWCHFLTIL